MDESVFDLFAEWYVRIWVFVACDCTPALHILHVDHLGIPTARVNAVRVLLLQLAVSEDLSRCQFWELSGSASANKWIRNSIHARARKCSSALHLRAHMSISAEACSYRLKINAFACLTYIVPQIAFSGDDFTVFQHAQVTRAVHAWLPVGLTGDWSVLFGVKHEDCHDLGLELCS